MLQDDQHPHFFFFFFFTSQTVYHLKVNWVQVPFSQNYTATLCKNNQQPHTPRQILIYGEDKSGMEDGSFLKPQKLCL